MRTSKGFSKKRKPSLGWSWKKF